MTELMIIHLLNNTDIHNMNSFHHYWRLFTNRTAVIRTVSSLFDDDEKTIYLMNHYNNTIELSFDTAFDADGLEFTVHPMDNQGITGYSIRYYLIDTVNGITNSGLYNVNGEDIRIMTPVVCKFDRLELYLDKKGSFTNDWLVGIPELKIKKGSKEYRVGNYQETEQTLKKQFLFYWLSMYRNHFQEINRFYYKKNDAQYLIESLKQSGISINNVYYEELTDYIMFLFEFVFLDGENDGEIRAALTGGKYQPVIKGKNETLSYTLVDYLVIGYWKIDDTGCLWIKTGMGEWKNAGNNLNLYGTLLGNIVKKEKIIY